MHDQSVLLRSTGDHAIGLSRARIVAALTPLRITAGAGFALTLVCLGALTWVVRAATNPARCPDSLPYQSFCQAQQADDLGAVLLRLAMVYAVGMFLTGAAAFLLWSRDSDRSARVAATNEDQR